VIRAKVRAKIPCNPLELYSLGDDPYERRDLAATTAGAPLLTQAVTTALWRGFVPL